MNELNPERFYLITKRGPLDTVMMAVIGAIEAYAKTKKIRVVLPEDRGYIGSDDSAIIPVPPSSSSRNSPPESQGQSPRRAHYRHRR